MDKKTVILLEEFKAQGVFTEEEAKALFELMNLNTSNETDLKGEFVAFDLNEEVEQAFLGGIQRTGRTELKKEMNEWSKELERAVFLEGGAAPNEFENIPQAALKVYFSENPTYGVAIRAANRNNGLKILSPSKGFEWKAQTHVFSLGNTEQTLLQIQIENNQEKPILEQEISVVQNQFSIDLDVNKLLPGRYYLKILSNDFFLMEFFIRKDLMPD